MLLRLTYSARWQEPCHYVGEHKYDHNTAVTLSVFLGMFGVDRFYLGYYSIGLMKLFTFGFFMIGQLLDVILIATQVVGPADGSAYFAPYYAARPTAPLPNNETIFTGFE
eukprot:m.35604 g.35604  ORF g.35604 m.35604 type:complete len:110 (-) comp44182_c0_seq3:31-360(-)